MSVTRNLPIALPLVVAGVVITTFPLAAAEWPQWRGPQRNGKSAETGLLQEWPPGGPAIAWQTNGLGGGYSSVAVTGDRVFTMGDLEGGQFVIALKESDGAPVWKTRVGDVHEDRYAGPRSTPTVDGQRLYVLSTDGNLVCLDVATGKEHWRRSLVTDYEGYLMRAMGSYQWQFSESPLIDGRRVVVTPGHINALMVALDKETGEEIWRTKGSRLGPIGADGAGYSSAVISQAAGVRHYVQLVGRGLIGVDADSGELLWGYNRVASDIANIATPIVHGDYVFASAGYGTGAALVKIVRSDQGLEAEEVYFLSADVLQNHHGGLILHEGTVYTGTGHNKGFPIAADFMKGDVAWGPERNAGQDSAAIAYADQRLYFRYRDGRMILIEASPEAYRERGTFMIPNVELQSWSMPVVANGKLWLREQDRLYCYDITASTGPADSTGPAAGSAE